jgi:HEAT repeat protein
MGEREPIAERVAALAGRIGVERLVGVCTDLMSGASREEYVEELRSLTGHAWQPGDEVFDPEVWRDFWLRTWGARGLLYVWEDSAAGAVVAGLDDPHWRPAEMCLKVSTRRELGAGGPAAVRLSVHELPRVRAQALRTLGAAGDTDHVEAVRARLADEHPDVRRHAARALEQMSARLDLEPFAG